MTKEKSLSQQFVFHSILLFLTFSCAENKDFSRRSQAEENPYQRYPQTYQSHYKPYSRSYNNPYEITPQNRYPYYDFDQYYTPPSRYKNVEQNNSGINDKF